MITYGTILTAQLTSVEISQSAGNGRELLPECQLFLSAPTSFHISSAVEPLQLQILVYTRRLAPKYL